ncbi:MAG: hypothetical protein R2813_01600 [Flavobacteriales bacterium]
MYSVKVLVMAMALLGYERYGMRKFLYHNNSSGPAATQDPRIATDYYNMLRGIWKDGTPMTFGGNGYNPSDPNAIPAHYMFPGTTDPENWGTDGVDPGQGDWSEVTAGNPPGDRRFVQSSGPFQLAPGQVNNITVGIVWMQAQSGGRLQSVEDMRTADDKTQALFDSCFEILDGPHAPDVTIQELDGEVILMLSNPINSNNYQEGYSTVDPFQAAPDSVDTNEDGDLDLALTPKEKEIFATYRFEGYQVFQLYDESVGTNDLDDPDKARLVAQVDIRNDVDKLINYVFNSELKVDEPQLKVDGDNQGISHSFQIKEDAFATGNSRLINHKTYYYMVIAYAYNRYGDGYENLQYIDGIYDPATNRLEGQKIPYLASRTSPSGPVRVYEAIPHKTEFEQNGIQLNSKYGDGVELTKIEGRGNGGNYAIIKEDYLDSISTNVEMPRIRYKAGNGPVGIQVVDPLMVQAGNYTLAMKDSSVTGDLANMYWEISGDSLDAVISSDQTIRYGNEQVIFELGLSVFVQYGYPATVKIPSGNGGEIYSSTNGYIGFDVIYEDETDQWLTGLVDVDANAAFNWIKSGNVLTPFGEGGDNKPFDHDDHTDDFRKYAQTEDPGAFLDEDQNWENIAGRTWAPFALCSYDTAHPIPYFEGDVSFAESVLKAAGLQNTPSVDVVITDDRNKWTRCAVLEAGENMTLTQGGVLRGELRRGLSVDKSGRNQLDAGFDASEGTMGGTQVLGDKVSLLTAEEKEYFKGLGFDANALRGVSFGMGWFPGYAIDVETGERLNMAFSEDSWLANENGADMMWNPTSSIAEILFGELRLGGKHMIYVFRHNVEDADIVDADRLMPAYDEGDFMFDKLIGFNARDFAMRTDRNNPLNKDYFAVMRAGAWVGYPLVAEDFKLFGKNAGSQESSDFNDVTIQLRSEQSYGKYASGDIIQMKSPSGTVTSGSSYYVRSGTVTANQTVGGTSTPVTFNSGSVFKAESSTITVVSTTASLVETVNDGLPLFNFNLDELAPTINNDIGVSQLDNISIVPNPYYAYSEYETGRLDNRVKIINLPEECTINIFTVNGVLVRTYRKDDPTISSVDWDLKNQDNITIASGLYVVHINVPGVGEKVLKWFGVLRPIDLNSF